MRKYSIFLLDADDTLFDFTACCRNALRRAMEKCGMVCREGYHLQYLEINNAQWRRLERGEITRARLFAERFVLFLQKIGEPTARAAALNEAYVSALSEECVPFAGAKSFLRELSGMGRVYIVTNGAAFIQKGRFEKSGFGQYFAGVFISEQAGAYKPSLRFYEYVAAHIPDFIKEETLLIGDSLTSDMALAAAAGLDAVWFNPEGKPLPAGAGGFFEARGYADVLAFASREKTEGEEGRTHEKN